MKRMLLKKISVPILALLAGFYVNANEGLGEENCSDNSRLVRDEEKLDRGQNVKSIGNKDMEEIYAAGMSRNLLIDGCNPIDWHSWQPRPYETYVGTAPDGSTAFVADDGDAFCWDIGASKEEEIIYNKKGIQTGKKNKNKYVLFIARVACNSPVEGYSPTGKPYIWGNPATWYNNRMLYENGVSYFYDYTKKKFLDYQTNESIQPGEWRVVYAMYKKQKDSEFPLQMKVGTGLRMDESNEGRSIYCTNPAALEFKTEKDAWEFINAYDQVLNGDENADDESGDVIKTKKGKLKDKLFAAHKLTGDKKHEVLLTLAEEWAENFPLEACKWAKGLPAKGTIRAEAIRKVIYGLAKRGMPEVKDFIKSLPKKERDLILSEMGITL